MGWGGLLGAGKGLSAVGESIDEDLKAARVNEWKVAQTLDDRAYENKKLIEQRDYDKEDLNEKRKYDKELIDENRAYEKEEKRLDRKSNEGIRISQAQAQAERDRVNNANRIEAARIRAVGDLGGAFAIDPQKELLIKAEEHADKMISNKAGWLSPDSADFKQFGGNREQARQFFIQEFMRQNGGGQAPNLKTLLDSKFGQSAQPPKG